MQSKIIDGPDQERETTGGLRSWIMVALTLIFVLLYAAALMGWVRPIADEKTVGRLEPIIFVIIGYYFGRLPSQQMEKTLKGEISRHTQKANAAQHAKEQAQQARESLEEKMKNVRAALVSWGAKAGAKTRTENPDGASRSVKEDAVHQSVITALNILNS